MKKYDAKSEQEMRQFFEGLSEKGKRHYAAIEARKIGYGGQRYMAKVLGCSTKTIQRGQVELAENGEPLAEGRIRRPGGGRKPYDQKKRIRHGVFQGNRDVYGRRPNG